MLGQWDHQQRSTFCIYSLNPANSWLNGWCQLVLMTMLYTIFWQRYNPGNMARWDCGKMGTVFLPHHPKPPFPNFPITDSPSLVPWFRSIYADPLYPLQSELYHWVDVLDIFDDIMERCCQSVGDNKWMLMCDQPENAQVGPARLVCFQ